MKDEIMTKRYIQESKPMTKICAVCCVFYSEMRVELFILSLFLLWSIRASTKAFH